MTRSSLLAAMLMCSALTGPGMTAGAPSYDVIVRNGMVADGTGAPLLRADVGISGGHVLAVGDLSKAKAAREIDAKGLYVAPGFINSHDHAIPEALPTATNMLWQGVTTEIVNADGWGPTDIRRQLGGYAAPGMALNIGAQIGFNSVWTEAMGQADVRPTQTQIAAMGQVLLGQMQAGAWGVSSGLDYKPAYFAKPEEVSAIIKPVAPWRTFYQNHDRLNQENNFSSIAGMRETINIAATAGLTPVITHMKLQGHEQGMAPAFLDELSASIARGERRVMDVYPYLAGASTLTGLTVPGWAMEGGYEQFVIRVKDKAIRAKVAAEIENAIQARFNGPQNMLITDINTDLPTAMRELGAGAGETVILLLETANMRGIFRFGAEKDLEAILRHPQAAIACDCGAMPDPGSTIKGRFPHPRDYGTFPRVLGHYVRETGLLSWEDAIRKMTGLPATLLGMVDRGYLLPGMAADVAIFDPATIIDKADYTTPTALPVGMRYVLVNGVVALDPSGPTRKPAGTTLWRAPDMPSRLESKGQRQAAGKTVVAAVESVAAKPVTLDYDLVQADGARMASGHLRLSGPAKLEAESFGLLQTAPGWASVTGTARDGGGKRHAFTLITDEGNPMVPAGSRTVSFYLDGRLAYRSTP